MPVLAEIQFQISLLNIASPGAAEPQAQELQELLLDQQKTQTLY
jgi:hypothetical protein